MTLDNDLMDAWLAVGQGLLPDERARELITECQALRDEAASEETILRRLREKSGVLDDTFRGLDELAGLTALTAALADGAEWLETREAALVDFTEAIENTDCTDSKEAVAVLAKTAQTLIECRDDLKGFIALLDEEEKPAGQEA